MRTLVSMALLAGFVTVAATVPSIAEWAGDGADNPVELKEWLVPYPESRPRDPAVAASNEVWFVGQSGNYLAVLNPASGEFAKHELADEPGPHNVIAGADGVVWYTGNLEGYIGRFDSKTEKTEKIKMPDPEARDPHTLVFDDAKQNIWFTVQGGDFIGRLNVESRKVDLVKVPTEGARPYGIKIAPDGTPWVALFGTDKLASVEPETMKITEHELPNADARPRRLGITSNGQIYYTDYARGFLGHYDPKKDAFEEWQLPDGADSKPYGMAIDAKNRIWVAETGVTPNMFIGFDPEKHEVFSKTPILSGGGSVRNMDFDAATQTVWFGTDDNTIARAKVGE